MPVQINKDGTFAIDVTFHAGSLNTTDDSRELSEGETPNAKNSNQIGKGSVMKRYGYKTYSKKDGISGGVRGLIPYEKTGETRVLLIPHENGKLYKIDRDNLEWEELGAWGTDDGTRVRGIEYFDLAIFGNGGTGNAVKKYDGTDINNLGGNPQNGNIFEEFAGMLIIAGNKTNPRRYEFSEVDTPEKWNQDNAKGGSAGRPITGLKGHQDALIAFGPKDKAGLQVSFDADDIIVNLTKKEITDRTGGAVSHDAIVATDKGFMFLSRGEFQRYGITESSGTVRKSPNISHLIRDVVKRINCEKFQQATATRWDNKYMCAVALDQSVRNNTLFIWDFSRETWGMWQDFPASSWTEFDTNVCDTLMLFGHETEPKVCTFNTEFSDDGKAIEFEHFSKIYMPGIRSRWDTFEVYGSTTIPGQSDFVVNIDGVEHVEPLDPEKDENLLLNRQGGGHIGDNAIGQGNIGGTEFRERLPEMFKFYKKEQFPSTMNHGAEFFYGIRNSKLNQGVKLDRVIVKGKVISS